MARAHLTPAGDLERFLVQDVILTLGNLRGSLAWIAGDAESGLAPGYRAGIARIEHQIALLEERARALCGAPQPAWVPRPAPRAAAYAEGSGLTLAAILQDALGDAAPLPAAPGATLPSARPGTLPVDSVHSETAPPASATVTGAPASASPEGSAAPDRALPATPPVAAAPSDTAPPTATKLTGAPASASADDSAALLVAALSGAASAGPEGSPTGQAGAMPDRAASASVLPGTSGSSGTDCAETAAATSPAGPVFRSARRPAPDAAP